MSDELAEPVIIYKTILTRLPTTAFMYDPGLWSWGVKEIKVRRRLVLPANETRRWIRNRLLSFASC